MYPSILNKNRLMLNILYQEYLGFIMNTDVSTFEF